MNDKGKLEKKGQKNSTKIVIGTLIGIVLIVVIALLLWFLNRKYEVVFDYNNGTTEEVLYVKHNKTISSQNIKGKDDLGNLFIDWYEIIDEKNGDDILAENPFDFKTKITKNIELKAVYNEKVEKITISFDSRDGSRVDSLTIEKGSNLELPEDPTKKGYTFGNWETESEIPITDGANLSESMTLYAVWKKNSTEDEKKSETTKTYYCEDGYTLSGTKCSKTEMIQGTLIKETCESNYQKNGDVCISNVVSSYATAKCPSESYTRMPGYDYCYSLVQHVSDSATCTNNYSQGKYYNGYCYYGTSEEIEYSCPDGFKMIKNYSSSADKSHECHSEAAIIKQYSCPDGYNSTSGDQCAKVITKAALVK